MAKRTTKKKSSHRKLLAVGPDAPFQFVEAYKSLRTNLEFISATSDCRTILVTSSVPMEGKSNVAINLAMTLASTGKRVVLVDGDLRKGQLSSYMRVPRNHAGFTSMIAGNSARENVLVPLRGSDLILLPTGPLPPSPAELLSSDKIKMLFDELTNYADYVIVDTPPVSVVTDAAILNRVADGVILVVRPGITTIQGAQLSKKNLEAVNARILGVVINGYDVQKSNKRDGYYYSYSYGYYSDDGKKDSGNEQDDG
jgi:capsular exopolysaccharide synthesis family protein